MKSDEEGTGGRGLGEFFSFPASVSWDAKREDLFARLDGGSDVPLYLRRPVQTPFLLPLLLYPRIPCRFYPSPSNALYPAATPVAPRFSTPTLSLSLSSLCPSYSPYVSQSYG